MSLIIQSLAFVWAVWAFVVIVVQAIGIYQLFRYHSAPPSNAVSSTLQSDDVPHVTVIRPVKGLESGLYECLVCIFQQNYPREKLTIYLCVPSTNDAAYPVLQRVLVAFPTFDARIFVEAQDPFLHGASGHADNLGPNPKIRNVSRAYREAKGDIIWIVDSNVWVGKGVAGRMVDKLNGYLPGGRRATPYKFVHQLPLVVDLPSSVNAEEQALLLANGSASSQNGPIDIVVDGEYSHVGGYGGRLEEMFMATTHAKFYNAINTVGIAPCIVGKSNMFRKSHLDRLTDPSQNRILSTKDEGRGRGIDFFSSYICEDHLIGDLLWRSRIPGYANHGLVSGDLAIQPVSGMSVRAYIARRVRWLRVRKWTVITATLVEPGVESLLCCFYSSFSLTTLPWVHPIFGIPQTWKATLLAWIVGAILWMLVDRLVYLKLHRCESVEVDQDTPTFARGCNRAGGMRRTPFLQWAIVWCGREVLALPIWIWAVLLGATVTWRGKCFNVRMDMRVTELKPKLQIPSTMAASDALETPRSSSKDRLD